MSVPGNVAVSIIHDRICVSNDTVRFSVGIKTGQLLEIGYGGHELLYLKSVNSRNSGGYWTLAGNEKKLGFCKKVWVSIDPADREGNIARISCAFTTGTAEEGIPVQFECHYWLLKGASALYCSSVLRHGPGDGAFSLELGRFALKLNPEVFDYLIVDQDRRRQMPSPHDWGKGEATNMKEARRLHQGMYAGTVEHKYAYSAVLFDTPAYGWSSSDKGIGVWMINPSIEYISGGATKVELTGHLDEYSDSGPVLLNVWHGPHYGGTKIDVEENESWSKTIGPFAIYFNQGRDPNALWTDALKRAEEERAAWPYGWANIDEFEGVGPRTQLTGRIVISDPLHLGSSQKMIVGLTPPDSVAGNELIDWQRNGKDYQYWCQADSLGHFRITGVRPGRFTLRAISDGVLGELAVPNIELKTGAPMSVGEICWEPQRFGEQIWEIGYPDRTARKYRNGDRYWHWGLYYKYNIEFPTDISFVIGESDFRTDWNYAQPPRIVDGKVSPTTWSILFNLAEAPVGRAHLRLAIAGSRLPRGVRVFANNNYVGTTGRLPDTGVMHRDGIRGYWCERCVAFDCTYLKSGQNKIALHVPALRWAHGILYDYIRLEIDRSAQP